MTIWYGVQKSYIKSNHTEQYFVFLLFFVEEYSPFCGFRAFAKNSELPTGAMT